MLGNSWNPGFKQSARLGTALLAATIALSAVTPALSQTRLIQQKAILPGQRLTGTIQFSAVSPPESGVKLIEEVFQRVRSAPMVAMAKNKVQQQESLPQGGPTDYRLAIRPKTMGKMAQATAPTLRLVPTDSIASALPPTKLDSFVAGAGGAAAPAPVATLAKAEPPAQALPEAWLGNRQFPLAPGAALNQRSGLWEKQAQQISIAQGYMGAYGDEGNANGAANEVSNRPVNGRGQAIPDLATAASRFANVAGKLQDAERIAMQAPMAPPTVRYEQSQTASVAEQRADKAKMVSLKQRDITPERARKKASVAKDLKEEKPFADLDDGIVDRSKTKIAMNGDIALLPPNVVTGIPLVRLGIPEKQAGSALSGIGSMKQQKVNKWSVWSWQRATNPTNAALQLYMRNGLLDAMRIFDPSLIAPDFGVKMGDELAKVKEKFGEPAFILQEPGPGAGQNYIYPISQVGFQLARPAPDQPPRVVSVLIFNVK